MSKSVHEKMEFLSCNPPEVVLDSVLDAGGEFLTSRALGPVGLKPTSGHIDQAPGDPEILVMLTQPITLGGPETRSVVSNAFPLAGYRHFVILIETVGLLNLDQLLLDGIFPNPLLLLDSESLVLPDVSKRWSRRTKMMTCSCVSHKLAAELVGGESKRQSEESNG